MAAFIWASFVLFDEADEVLDGFDLTESIWLIESSGVTSGLT